MNISIRNVLVIALNFVAGLFNWAFDVMVNILKLALRAVVWVAGYIAGYALKQFLSGYEEGQTEKEGV